MHLVYRGNTYLIHVNDTNGKTRPSPHVRARTQRQIMIIQAEMINILHTWFNEHLRKARE